MAGEEGQGQIVHNVLRIKLTIYRPKWCKNIVVCAFTGIETLLDFTVHIPKSPTSDVSLKLEEAMMMLTRTRDHLF